MTYDYSYLDQYKSVGLDGVIDYFGLPTYTVLKECICLSSHIDCSIHLNSYIHRYIHLNLYVHQDITLSSTIEARVV